MAVPARPQDSNLETTRGAACFLALALALCVAGCSDPVALSGASEPALLEDGLVGVDPVSRVHLFENHSSSLIAWRSAGVRDRILVHLDGHVDFDWLPDETIARIAVARPSEIGRFELHPYALDGSTLSRFGIWNFIYPAARLGIVREMVWVVPDGTVSSSESAARLVRETILGKLQGVSLEEASTLRLERGRIYGTLLGLPVTICELGDLPEFDEPVLLDVDLDYFTTRSAITQEVVDAPWIDPEAVIESLRDRGVRTDLVTISYSTIGGYFPPAGRWIGAALQRRLRDPASSAAVADPGREEAQQRLREGLAEQAEAAFRRLLERRSDDATLWYGLSRALAGNGRDAEAARALEEAARRDPLFEHAQLFEADRFWMNGDYARALGLYEAYVEARPEGPFFPYALRRHAGCLMHLKRDAEAIDLFRRVIEIAPDHGDSRLDYGLLLREHGRVAEAVQQFQAAREILPDLSAYAMALGSTHLTSGRFAEGVPHLRDAVRLRPCWPAARANLATGLVQLGNLAEAGEHVRVAMSLQPANPQLRQIELVLRRQGVSVPVAETSGP